MPSNLDWSGQPDKWNNAAPTNSGLTCEITGYGNGDTGCLSSLSNTLIYYAKAKGVKVADIAKYDETAVGGEYKSGIDDVTPLAGAKSYKTGDAEVPAVGLYLAQQIMDRTWNNARDDIGLTRVDHNGSLARMFSQPVHVPKAYNGTMPSGDTIANGATFLSLRSMYTDSSKCKGVKTSDEALKLVQTLKDAYDKDEAAGAKWSGGYSASSAEGKAELEKFTNVAAVELKYHRFWHMGDAMMALGTLAELYPDLEPTKGNSGTDPTDPKPGSVTLWGDADESGTVDILDVIQVNKFLLGVAKLSAQGALNADLDQSGDPDSTDSLNILKLALNMLSQNDMPIKK